MIDHNEIVCVCVCVNWFQVAQDRVQFLVLVNAVMDLRIL
jgi:hypothetical protein